MQLCWPWISPLIMEGSSNLFLEGDSLTTILAINRANLFSDMAISPIITDIQLKLQQVQVWTASKNSSSANFRAYHIAKWAASNLVFGNITNSSPILSSFRINSVKDPPV